MTPALLTLVGPPAALDVALAHAERQLPFVPTERACHREPAGDAGGRAGDEVWAVQWQAAAGPRRPPWLAQDPRGWLASTWLGPADASALHELALGEGDVRTGGGMWPLGAHRHGQGVLLWQADHGVMLGTCDRHGGGLLYHGHAGTVVACGTRARMVGAALAPDGRPELEPGELFWPLARPGAPVGAATAWRGVSLCPQGGLVRVQGGLVSAAPAPRVDGVQHSVASLAAGLVSRVTTLDALPDHPVEVMLSGGKDIRLVLAALKAGSRLGRVTRGVIWAPEGDPDLAVARLLAAQLGFPVEVRESPAAAGPWRDGFERHAFLSEGMVHAWDRKGAPTVRDVVTLNGYFGELYKSHVRRAFALGGWAQRRFYRRRAWFDRHDLLTREARAWLQARFEPWLAARQAEGHPWDLVHDRWHREARMQRWVGHILQAEACAAPWLQLLPGNDLLERYVAGPLADRTQHRLHFELIRHLAPELLELPLAEDRWSTALDPAWTPPKAQRRQGSAPGAQAQLWRAHGAEMADWLRSEATLTQWVDRAKLDALLRRALAGPPAREDLIALTALLGIRAALDTTRRLPVTVVPSGRAGEAGS